MLVSCDLIGQLNGGHFFNATQFYKGYSSEDLHIKNVTCVKYMHLQFELTKPMVAIAAFFATS